MKTTEIFVHMETKNYVLTGKDGSRLAGRIAAILSNGGECLLNFNGVLCTLESWESLLCPIIEQFGVNVVIKRVRTNEIDFMDRDNIEYIFDSYRGSSEQPLLNDKTCQENVFPQMLIPFAGATITMMILFACLGV